MAVHPTAQIHPSAVVEEGAVIGAGVTVGPFSVIGPKVVLHDNVVVKSHAVIVGNTQIGSETVVFSFASIGEVPQDLKYAGEETRLEIGARNRIREGVTMNLGTTGGGGVTRVGDDCLFMTGSHVGHDVIVGNRVIMANQAALAGHCQIEDDVIIGGLSGIHQWVRIGRGAIIGGVTMVTNDVIPNGLVHGPRGVLDGLNLVGLKRRGESRADISALRAAFKELEQGAGTFAERAERAAQMAGGNALVQEMTNFILGGSDRSFHTPGGK